MQAFHTFWTKPYRQSHDNAVHIANYELLTLVLSALMWQKKNGPIRLVTDSFGKDYFISRGLKNLWSGPIDSGLDALDGHVDPFLFWAAGKLYALGTMSEPGVMLDADMIVWEDISDRLKPDVTAAHAESLENPVYQNPDVFQMAQGYAYPVGWDFSISPANTAFLYIADDELRKAYVRESFDFMRALERADVHPAVTMCFAEQRILPMCAAEYGKSVSYILSDNMYRQKFVTHVWGYKSILANSEDARREFCAACIRKTSKLFPEWKETVMHIAENA